MANTENSFIKSNVDFTAASGWLQRLVRCLRWNSGRTYHAYLPSVPSNANRIWRDVENAHDNRPSLPCRVVMDDEDLTTCVSPAARVELVLAGDAVAETDDVMVGLERDEACAVDAAVFNLPRADKRAVTRTAIVTLIRVNTNGTQNDQYDADADDEPLLRA